MMMSWNGKNKMTFGALGEPLALSTKTRRNFVPEGLQFEASDHDTCMKAHVMPSLMGRVTWNEIGSYELGNCHDVEVTMALKDGAV